MSDTDRDLACIRRMQDGDARALEDLYDRHTPLLLALASRMLGRPADAEDVVQEIWVRAWSRADSFDPARGTVAAWLVTMTRSRAIDRLRARASRDRAERAPFVDPPASGDAPPRDVEQRETAGQVRAALASLGPDQRQVLELAYFAGLTQSEIASRLGAPLGTVKSWTRQALTRLREAIPAGESA
jgi:RNA polymerase sigma-70 factor (ECF subfamily)